MTYPPSRPGHPAALVHLALGGADPESALPSAHTPNGVQVLDTDSGAFYINARNVAVPGWQRIAAVPGARQIAVDSNDLLVWKMQESSGATLANTGSAGSAGDGTAIGGATVGANGLFGHGVTTDGGTNATRSGVASAAGIAAIRPSGVEVTASGWFRAGPALLNPSALFARMYGATDAFALPNCALAMFVTPDGGLLAWVTRGGAATPFALATDRRFPTNQWALATVTYTGTLLSVYVNDRLVGARAFAPSAAVDWGQEGAWAVGCLPAAGAPAAGIDSSMCDFRVSGVARAADWVANRYRSGLGLFL